MQWVLIAGTWKTSDEAVFADVREAVRDIIEKGDGIITGGALGVDLVAAQEALRIDPSGKHLRFILPTPLAVYKAHYARRCDEGVISREQAKELFAVIDSLAAVRPEHLATLTEEIVDMKSYYLRSSAAVALADRLIAFSVDDSPGTAYTIRQAMGRRIPFRIKRY